MSMIFQCIKGLSVAVFLRSGFENARELFGSLLPRQVESGNTVSGEVGRGWSLSCSLVFLARGF